jgi:hypothetical protein
VDVQRVAVIIRKTRRKTATTKRTAIRVRMKNPATAVVVRMATIKNLATMTTAAITRMATMKIQTRPDREKLIYKRAEATEAK